MTPSRIFALLALLCWGASIAGLPRERMEWVLVDASPSVWAGNSQAWDALASIPSSSSRLEEAWRSGRAFRVGREIRPWIPGEEPDSAGGSPLGSALAFLRERMLPGDRLYFLTDGRSTDPLPPTWNWKGGEVIWEPIGGKPGLQELEAPFAWPERGGLVIRARISGSTTDVEEVKLETPGNRRLEINALGRNQSGKWEWKINPGEARNQKLPIKVSARFKHGWESLEKLIRPFSRNRNRVLKAEDGGAQILATLAADGVALVVSSRAAAWASLPADLCPFLPEPSTRPVCVVLDCSGSMAEGGLDEARQALEEWANWDSGDLVIFPFSGGLDEPFNLQDTGGVGRLRSLQPHGPTRLAAALESAATTHPLEIPFILVGDGQAETPAGGWVKFRRRVLEGRTIWSVPVGPEANLDLLASLGPVIEGRTLRRRLADGLGGISAATLEPARAVAGASLPLPSVIPGASSRPLMKVAFGGEVLFKDVLGRVAGAALRHPEGIVIGLLSPLHPEIKQAFASTLRSARGGGGVTRSKRRLSSLGGLFRVIKPTGAGQPDLTSPGPPQGFSMPDPAPFEFLSLEFPGEDEFSLPPERDGEFGADPGDWVAWCSRNQVKTTLPDTPFSRLLLGGLLLALVALSLRPREMTIG